MPDRRIAILMMNLLSVKARTAWCMLLCVAVPLAGLSVIAYRASESALTRLIDTELVAVVHDTLERVERADAELQVNLRIWSGSPELRDIAIDDADRRIANRLRVLGRGNPMIEGMLVLDANGETVATSGARAAALRVDTAEVWRAARSDGFGGMVFSSAGLTGEPVMLAIEPILDRGTELGALVAVIDWRSVRTELARITMPGGPQGADRRLILRNGEAGHTVYDSIDAVAGAAPASVPAHVWTGAEHAAAHEHDTHDAHDAHGDSHGTSEMPGSVRIELDGERYLAHVASVGSSEAGGSGQSSAWELGVFVSERAAYTEVLALRQRFAQVTLFFVLFACAVATWFARSIVVPVGTLAEAARGLAAGRFDTPLPASGRDEIGSLARSFAAMRDAVREHQDEMLAAREEAERASEMKSQFLANMSHEIRTPMNGVLGMTQLVLDAELEPATRRFAQTAYNSAESLLQIINDILDFSKMEAGKVELHPVEFDLREAVEEVCAQLAGTAHAKGLELVCDVPENLSTHVLGDDGRLRQVLFNLLGNAIKFTESGEVGVTVESIEPEARSGDEHADDGQGVCVTLAVHDTGIGIDAEAAARVFDHFQQADGSTTRKYGGTGLGLAISRQLIELMGGAVTLDSAPGEGTRFTFTLRLASLAAPARSRSRAGALTGRRLLIVDDNATNREILEHQTRAWGAHAVSVGDGAAALAYLAATASAGEGQATELAILDFQMPGMDGVSLARAIKAVPALADTTLVLLSSVSEAADEATCREVGIEACLLKPARQEELYRTLVEALGEGASEVPADAPSVGSLIAAPAQSEGAGGNGEATAGAVPAGTADAARDDAADAARDGTADAARDGRADAARDGAADAARDAAADGACRVLLVEDHPVNQLLASTMLKGRGYAVEVAGDGRQGVERLAAERFDVVLMDCSMPVMDGFLATAAVREAEASDPTRGRVPIIALTANALAEDRERCLAAGMDDYLSKPFRREELVAAIERWVADDGKAREAA